MDPITGILAIAGFGMSLFGTLGSMNTANQQSQVNQQIAGIQQKENTQRQLAMQISARTKSLDSLRAAQRNASMGKAAAVAGGAQYGSGEAGGQAQAANANAQNQQNISQNLQIGNTLFGMDNSIDSLKMQLASLQSQSNTYSGISALGGDISRAAGPGGQILGNLFGGFGGGGNNIAAGAPTSPGIPGLDF